jgi:hypothetical protein
MTPTTRVVMNDLILALCLRLVEHIDAQLIEANPNKNPEQLLRQQRRTRKNTRSGSSSTDTLTWLSVSAAKPRSLAENQDRQQYAGERETGEIFDGLRHGALGDLSVR